MNANQTEKAQTPANANEVPVAGPLALTIEEHLNRLRRTVENMSPEKKKRRAEQDQAWKEMERQRRNQELRDKSGAPLRQLEIKAGFRNAWGTKFHELLPRLGTGTVLALAGLENTGKTQMAVEFVRQITEKGQSALYTTAQQLFSDLKFGSRTGERDPLLKYRRPRLLIIDNLQRMTGSSWEVNMLQEIIEARHGDKRDTILVCDSTVDELIQLLGKSATDKINQCGGFVACEWPVP